MPDPKWFMRIIVEQNINVAWWADHAWSVEWCNSSSKLCSFISDAGPHPLALALPRPPCTRLNHLRTSVGHFRSSMQKWGMAPSAICECDMEDQFANHNIQTCQYSPDGVHGLQVLDDDTMKWLSTSCPNI